MSKLKYTVISHLALVVEYWVGDISHDDVIAAKTMQLNDKKWNKEYATLSDLRDGVFSNKIADVEKIMQHFSADKRLSSYKRTAQITKNSNQVVFQMLMDEVKPRHFKNEFAIFSTLLSSLDWLGVDAKYFDLVVGQLESLKQQIVLK